MDLFQGESRVQEEQTILWEVLGDTIHTIGVGGKFPAHLNASLLVGSWRCMQCLVKNKP